MPVSLVDVIGPTSFIAGHWHLIENAEMRCLSLRAAWGVIVGSEPDLSPTGGMAMGMHIPTDDEDVRLLLYSNATSEEAVEHAAALVQMKYGLREVRHRWRQMSQSPEQWLPERMPVSPIDPAWLTVWPEHGKPVQDPVVLELRNRPGHFIGRNQPTVARVEDALLFPSPGFAYQCMAVMAIHRQAVVPKWRSAALAEEDQRLAAGDDR